jgi:cobyrinic acid a,c-diamide synthase
VLEPFFGFKKKDILFGHEFHYTSILGKGDVPIVDVEDAYGNNLGSLGSKKEYATGTFFHLIGSLR